MVEAYRWSPLKSAERGHTKEGQFVYAILMHLKIENLDRNSYILGDLLQHIISWSVYHPTDNLSNLSVVHLSDPTRMT